MGLFKKKHNLPTIEEVQKEIINIKYIPYIFDGEEWQRIYDKNEVELIKKDSYEQGFKDGVASCSENNEQKIIPPIW